MKEKSIVILPAHKGTATVIMGHWRIRTEALNCIIISQDLWEIEEKPDSQIQKEIGIIHHKVADMNKCKYTYTREENASRM